MSFFKRQDIGRVYVIKMVLPGGTVVYKIGMCNSSRSTDRMMEILRSWFTKFRFVPYTELKLDMETGWPKELETHIHKCLEHKQFIPNENVSGGTEMFTEIDEFRVIQYLKHCNDNQFSEPLELSKEDYKHLGQFLSP
ncbi:MAG: GIY-YIG nuclease family protein [Gammaproteobacteria bacterium]|nr:GIY-YIG nuclease family protein [Gammaproteobacteria bacterium]